MKMCNFDPKIWIFGAKSHFLVLELRFLSTGHITSIPEASTFPFEPPRNISVSEVQAIFRGSPLFLAILGHSHVRGLTTLNFGPISMKLGGTVQAIERMTQKDNGPGPGRNYGETGVFTFGRKVVFGLLVLL